MKASRSHAPAEPQAHNASRATPQLRTRPDPAAASDRSTAGRDASQEAIVQRQRQAMVHHSPRVKQLGRYQEMAAQSPRVQDLGQLQSMADSSPHVTVQRKRQAWVNTSPRQVAQRRQLQRTFGQTVQRQGELDEDELQMKAQQDALQMQGMEDEELLQGKFEPVQRQGELEDDELQRQAKTGAIQRQGMEDEELLQGKLVGNDAPTQLQGYVDTIENHTGMPDGLKSGLEQLSGLDLSGVRVHYNSSKPAQLNALAYTQGNDIEVGPGQAKHLAHEGWHAVQQMQGRVKPTIQAQRVAINDDAGLEQEADVMGAKALQMKVPKDPATSNPMVQLMLDNPMLANVILQGKFETDPRMVAQLASVIQMNGWEIAGVSAKFIDYLLDFTMALIIAIEAFQDEEGGISSGAIVSLSITAVLSLLNAMVKLIADLKAATSKKDKLIAVGKIVVTLSTIIPVVVVLSQYGFSTAAMGAILSALIALKNVVLAGPEAIEKLKELVATVRRVRAASERDALLRRQRTVGTEMETIV